MLTYVVTCDYIRSMKREKKIAKWEISPEATAPLMLKETVALPGIGLSIPVRAAKAKLSALLELVASGQQGSMCPEQLFIDNKQPNGSLRAGTSFTLRG